VNSISEEVDVPCVETSILQSNLPATDSGVVVKFIREIPIANEYLRRNVLHWLTPAELVRSIGMLNSRQNVFTGLFAHTIFNIDLKWR
jgi:hypothetical protein